MSRSEQPFSDDPLGKAVVISGSWEYSDERRNNFTLDGASARSHRVREHEVKLDVRTRWAADTSTFVQVTGLDETRSGEADNKRVAQVLERGQMWIHQDHVAGTRWSLQAGRVKLLDQRAWWWEEEVDTLRARHDSGTWRLDAGIARELLRKSSADRGVQPDARGVTRFFGQATWPWAPRHALDVFWLVQHDRSPRPAVGAVFRDEDDTDPSDLRARWVGLRALGEWRVENGARLAYWADAAWLSGREHVSAFDAQADGTFRAVGASERRVHGNAFDIGATASLALLLRPSLTVGYAHGSPRFRQTGLQENKTRFASGKRWQRYGELVQPELSNLSVASVGTGVRVLADSSIELMLHCLRQVRASDHVPGSRLSAKPQGTSRHLGREVNLLVALREHSRIEFSFEASHFKPGTAFAPGERQAARVFEFGVSFRF
ncbi:MAG: alginate export family protein [Rubrivivax sp.]|nr:alginate export family protein [Rubrivivax sp.]